MTPWTPRRREFISKLEALLEEYRNDLHLDPEESAEEDSPVMPDDTMIFGWILVLNWITPNEQEDTWTTVHHPQGLPWVSRLGLLHAGVMTIGG